MELSKQLLIYTTTWTRTPNIRPQDHALNEVMRESLTHQSWLSRPGIQGFLSDLCFSTSYVAGDRGGGGGGGVA